MDRLGDLPATAEQKFMLMLQEPLDCLEDECISLRKENELLKLRLDDQLSHKLHKGVHVCIPNGRHVKSILLRMYLNTKDDIEGIVDYLRSKKLDYLCNVLYPSMTPLTRNMEFPISFCPSKPPIQLTTMITFQVPINPYQFVRELHKTLEPHFYRRVPLHLICYNIPKDDIQLWVAYKLNDDYSFRSSKLYFKLDELDMSVIKPDIIIERYLGKIEKHNWGNTIYKDAYKHMIYTDMYGSFPNIIKEKMYLCTDQDIIAKQALKDIVVRQRERSREEESHVGIVDESIQDIWKCNHYAGVEYNDL